MTTPKTIPHIEPEEHALGTDEKVVIRLFRPEDGPGIARLFRAVYGEGYPARIFYDPEALTRAFELGESFSVVARNQDGEVIAHMAFFRSSPYPNLYEVGAGMVLPQYRNAGINKLILSHIYDRIIPGLDLEEVWGEAVCNHIFMQKVCIQFKHVEVGMEVDLMPAEAYRKEGSASGRVASILVFRAYRSSPHQVYIPEIYEKELRFLYSGLDDRRDLAVSREKLSDRVSTQAKSETFDFAKVMRFAVDRIGGDFERCARDFDNDIASGSIRVAQISLNLAEPCVGEAISILRHRGYFLGGVLPRWFGHDGMLMQKIMGPPDWEGIHVFSDRAREILSMVKKDWEEVAGGA